MHAARAPSTERVLVPRTHDSRRLLGSESTCDALRQMRGDALQPEAVAVRQLRQVVTHVDGLLLSGLRVHVHLRVTLVVLGVLHVDGDEGAVDEPVWPEENRLFVVQVEVLHVIAMSRAWGGGGSERRTLR